MPNCPQCQNAEHVYEQGENPTWGSFVLCSRHGIQVSGERLVQVNTLGVEVSNRGIKNEMPRRKEVEIT